MLRRVAPWKAAKKMAVPTGGAFCSNNRVSLRRWHEGHLPFPGLGIRVCGTERGLNVVVVSVRLSEKQLSGNITTFGGPPAPLKCQEDSCRPF